MAFVQLESWRAAPTPRRAGVSSAALGPFHALLDRGWDLYIRRSFASFFSVLVHIFLIGFLINRLTDGTSAEAPPTADAITLIDLAAPGAAEAVAAAAQPAVPAAPVMSEVDLSRAADLPAPEWTMSSLRAPAPPASAGGSSSSDPFASAGGAGGNGDGPSKMNQFIGFGDGIGGELLLDSNMLEAARQAAMRAHPGARGTALVFLRVSPSGIVLAAVIRGGDRQIGSALRRELVGKRLFLVKSRIKDSALVALPPINIRGDAQGPPPPA
jgi:hypothetical protein